MHAQAHIVHTRYTNVVLPILMFSGSVFFVFISFNILCTTDLCIYLHNLLATCCTSFLRFVALLFGVLVWLRFLCLASFIFSIHFSACAVHSYIIFFILSFCCYCVVFFIILLFVLLMFYNFVWISWLMCSNNGIASYFRINFINRTS